MLQKIKTILKILSLLILVWSIFMLIPLTFLGSALIFAWLGEHGLILYLLTPIAVLPLIPIIAKLQKRHKKKV